MNCIPFLFSLDFRTRILCITSVFWFPRYLSRQIHCFSFFYSTTSSTLLRNRMHGGIRTRRRMWRNNPLIKHQCYSSLLIQTYSGLSPLINAPVISNSSNCCQFVPFKKGRIGSFLDVHCWTVYGGTWTRVRRWRKKMTSIYFNSSTISTVSLQPQPYSNILQERLKHPTNSLTFAMGLFFINTTYSPSAEWVPSFMPVGFVHFVLLGRAKVA